MVYLKIHKESIVYKKKVLEYFRVCYSTLLSISNDRVALPLRISFFIQYSNSNLNLSSKKSLKIQNPPPIPDNFTPATIRNGFLIKF